MKRLMFAALAAAALSAPALAEDSIAEMRQPAIDKCIAVTSRSPQPAETCTCIIDGIIEKIPGDDGVKMLKLFASDQKSVEEAAAAMGVSAADLQAFIDSHMQTFSEISMACTPN